MRLFWLIFTHCAILKVVAEILFRAKIRKKNCIAHDNIVVDQVEEKILEKLLFCKVQENVRRRF